jgi:dihydrofolate reductase
VPFASEETNEVVAGWFREADAFLFGRTTFGMLRSYWPNVTDPASVLASQLNSLPEYVVGPRLSDAEADWDPTIPLEGDPVERVRRLKDLAGRELQVHGSWRLVQTLHEAGSVDVYRLLQYSVVVGTGKRLFPEGATPAMFAIEPDVSRVLPGGVVVMTLTSRSFGRLAAGAYVVEHGRSTTSVQ